MQTRNPAFGFANPFAGQNRNNGFQRRPQQQQMQYDQEEQIDDPRFDVQAYMKIGFQTTHGVKFLNFGKTDKQLREASPLEAMILNHWRNGGDINDLLETMVIEIHDANPDLSEMAFVSRKGELIEPQEEEIQPVQPKRRRAAKPATEEAE